MTVDELTTMDGNKCILQLRGLRPFLSPKYDLRKHPNFKHTGEADKKNSFDPAKLISTRLTVAPNDLFTVYEADEVDEDIDGDEDTTEYDGYNPNA
jgi:type IV secretion system protein VirD4